MTEEKALALMEEGFHCSQVVYAYAAERLGMDRGQALKMTAALGGGVNHGDTCGTISGSAMALGTVFGFDTPDAEKDAALIKMIVDLQERFTAKHGSCLCRDLLDGYDKAVKGSVPNEHTFDNCQAYCTTACAILDEYLGSYYVK